MRKIKIGLFVNVLFAQLLKFIIPLLILGLVTRKWALIPSLRILTS